MEGTGHFQATADHTALVHLIQMERRAVHCGSRTRSSKYSLLAKEANAAQVRHCCVLLAKLVCLFLHACGKVFSAESEHALFHLVNRFN